MNKRFENSVRCLADKAGCSHALDVNDAEDSLENIIKRFQHRQSIIIKKTIIDHHFTSALSVLMKIHENVVVCAKPIANICNSCISSRNFLDKVKLANISPIFKAVDIILNSISKSFEKLIQPHLNPFFKKKVITCGVIEATQVMHY